MAPCLCAEPACPPVHRILCSSNSRVREPIALVTRRRAVRESRRKFVDNGRQPQRSDVVGGADARQTRCRGPHPNLTRLDAMYHTRSSPWQCVLLLPTQPSGLWTWGHAALRNDSTVHPCVAVSWPLVSTTGDTVRRLGGQGVGRDSCTPPDHLAAEAKGRHAYKQGCDAKQGSDDLLELEPAHAGSAVPTPLSPSPSAEKRSPK
jgi:hypothetical protein